MAKEIYIENIPDDYCALDLEFKLQDILGPSVYVCLGMGEMDFAAPSVVVVKFRDHNLAVWAAEKIEGVGNATGAAALGFVVFVMLFAVTNIN